jgi:Proto-chlorophyllide reductase 57 kD subunit
MHDHRSLPDRAMQWSEEAERALREVPFFVRPAVRRRIEALAGEAGLEQVDRSFYEQARARFGGEGAGDAVKK